MQMCSVVGPLRATVDNGPNLGVTGKGFCAQECQAVRSLTKPSEVQRLHADEDVLVEAIVTTFARHETRVDPDPVAFTKA